jgi:hypothetical protein
VLYTPPHPTSPVLSIGERHRCRNPRCGAKLKSPTPNRLDAFCCQGCFGQFFRSRCLVCEQLFTRKTERRLTCSRRKCRHEIERHRERYFGGRYLGSVLGPNASRSADKTVLKIGTFGGRPFAQVAGPQLTPTAFRLATLPLDPDLAARIERTHAPALEARKRAKRAAARAVLIKRHTPPANVLGGYKFPGAPVVDLSPPKWAVTSTWKPTGAGADVPPILEFLSRISAAIPTRRSEEVATSPGDDLHSWSAEEGKIT